MVANGSVSRKPEKSLYRELADGTAGAGVRIVVSVAVASGLVALALFVTCMIGLFVRDPRYARPSWAGSRPSLQVSEEVLAVAFILAGVAYLAALFWIWSRHGRNREIWLCAAMTVGTWVAAVCLSIGAEALFTGDEEVLVLVPLFAAGAVTVLIWLRAYRRYMVGRPLLGQGGQLDLRCPECDYSMVGLNEARCPECGQRYTIDDLVVRQDFEALRARRFAPSQAGPEVAANE